MRQQRQRELEQAQRVVIGMDPHKRSVTIEVMNPDEMVLGGGRFGTDRAGYAALTDYVNQLCPDQQQRVWAVEGFAGIGHHVATRLLAMANTSSTSHPGSRRGSRNADERCLPTASCDQQRWSRRSPEYGPFT